MMMRLLILLTASLAYLAAADGIPWNWAELQPAPKTFDAPHNDEPGVKALCYA